MTLDMPGTMGGAKIIFTNNVADNYNTTTPLRKLQQPMNETKIGIVGLGFVGGAIAASYEIGFDVTLVKVDPAKGETGTYQDLKTCDAVFVCVPSPQGADGSCDTSILEDVLSNLSNVGYNGAVISKCTAPPRVYERLQAQYKNLIHAPEFLTAANAVRDYANGTFAIIGGEVGAYRREAERVIRLGQRSLRDVWHCSIAEASLSKYTINSFMSTKVIFMNEIYNLAKELGCDYNLISNMVRSDSRIGNSHMQVPGPDGGFGFGGACFPKDTSALLKIAEESNVNMNVLDAAVKKNLLLRLTEPK
jgi:nucleotide sugar dehydrogenase